MPRILRDRLLCQLGDNLKASPQYAYIPGKSIDQVISRVAMHCANVRAALKEGMDAIYTKR